MDSTVETIDVKDENATDHVDESVEMSEPVDATNDPPKVKPRKINSRQLEKAPKIGRNQPCPCGSGKKYKKCHLVTQREKMQKDQEIRRQVDEFTKKSSESKSEEKEIPQENNQEL